MRILDFHSDKCKFDKLASNQILNSRFNKSNSNRLSSTALYIRLYHMNDPVPYEISRL